MAKTYTIELTDVQDKALSFACYSQQEWIDNAVTARANAAIDDIVSINMSSCNKDAIAIATGVDAQVTQAFTKNYVRTGKEQFEAEQALL
tara:strand:+ start:560 stop:829 length:270 start_codon:yes stop_codon:yes gene_type:complete